MLLCSFWDELKMTKTSYCIDTITELKEDSKGVGLLVSAELEVLYHWETGVVGTSCWRELLCCLRSRRCQCS